MYLQVENEVYVRRNTFPGRLGDAYIMSHVHVYPWTVVSEPRQKKGFDLSSIILQAHGERRLDGMRPT